MNQSDQNASHIMTAEPLSLRAKYATWPPLIFPDKNVYVFWKLGGDYRQSSNINRTLVDSILVDNYILVLDLTPGLNGLGKDNSKTINIKVWGFGAPYMRGMTLIFLNLVPVTYG